MTVRDVRLWRCDVAECETTAEKTIQGGAHSGDEKHDIPTGWVSITVNSIRGHHNVSKWLCPHHVGAHIMPMFPEHANHANEGGDRG